MRTGPLFAKCALLRLTKPLLFINHHQSKIAEARRSDGVRANDYVDLAPLHPAQNLSALSGARRAQQGRDTQTKTTEPAAESVQVLAGQQCGWRCNRDLVPRKRC